MSASLRKRHGVVYTPEPIVELILDNVLPSSPGELANAVVCDPACGDGAFLTAVARRALNCLNRAQAVGMLRKMSGYDIDAKAVERCKARLDAMLAARYPAERICWNISVRDALHRKTFEGDYGRFTHVVGNPPYVRVQHLEQAGRKRISGQWSVLRGATDLYLIFYELALDLLRSGGVVGFITPSSWLRSDSGSLLRACLVKSHKVKKIIDFREHQMFDDVTTYTAIAVVQKDGATDAIPVDMYDGSSMRSGGAVMLDSDNPSRAWWIAQSESDEERMRALMNRGPRLGEIADIHVGIQTLADSVFIMPREEAAFMQLEDWILKDIVKASVMKNGHDLIERVVIFPLRRQRAKLMPEERIAKCAPRAYQWLLSNKERLLRRDKGRSNPSKWYGFGRHVSIVSGFGDKILTSGMNKKPNFQQCPNSDATILLRLLHQAEDTRKLGLAVPRA